MEQALSVKPDTQKLALNCKHFIFQIWKISVNYLFVLLNLTCYEQSQTPYALPVASYTKHTAFMASSFWQCCLASPTVTHYGPDLEIVLVSPFHSELWIMASLWNIDNALLEAFLGWVSLLKRETGSEQMLSMGYFIVKVLMVAFCT